MALVRNDSGYASIERKTRDEEEEQGYVAKVHPLKDFVASQTDDYILENWDFEDSASRQDFLNKRVSKVACLYFPSALDERIILVARLFSVLYLTGGMSWLSN